MAYDNTGLAWFTTNPGPGIDDPVSEGAQWITDILSYLTDATNGPTSIGQLPIGGIIMSTSDNRNPADYLGYGTWVKISGRVLIGEGTGSSPTTPKTIGTEGGAETHTLVTAEMPAHTHSFDVNHGDGASDTPGQSDGSFEASVATSSVGGGGAHNNMQPYLVVYMWKRSA